MSVVKDTIREFTEYVEETDRLNGMTSEERVEETADDVDEEESRDSQDKPYTLEEAETCRTCLVVVRRAEEALRLSLRLATETMDASPTQDPDTASPASSWMADLHRSCGGIAEGVVDLSSELFVPFDEETIGAKHASLKAAIAELLRLLGQQAYATSDIEELSALLSSISTCALR